ncbi:hypothetical protein JOQ06_000953, partial [Pogonophryne albipinna]
EESRAFGNKMEEGEALIMAPHIPESERSAWRPQQMTAAAFPSLMRMLLVVETGEKGGIMGEGVGVGLPPRWLIRCRSEGGLSRCLHPCLGPLEHGANHFSGQSSHGPALPSLAQDSLVTPRINKLELCQLGGVDRQRGQDRQREKEGEEDDLRV